MPVSTSHLDTSSIYKNIVAKDGRETGINIEVNDLWVHSMREAAATNALSNEADIAKSAGMARSRKRIYHPPLRPAQEQARRQPDNSRKVLRMGCRHSAVHRTSGEPGYKWAKSAAKIRFWNF